MKCLSDLPALRLEDADIKVPSWIPAEHADSFRSGVVAGWGRGVREALAAAGISEEPEEE